MRHNPLVSVLVHTKNSQRTIQNLLQSIKNQSYQNIEIIVVDNHSNDSTLRIAKNYTKKMYTYGPERSAQRNYAAKKATGDFFLVPDSDMVLGRDVIKECIFLVLKNSKIKAVIIPEKSFGEGFWAKCKALERSYYVGLSWMEGARFFEKKTFFEMKGYDERNTGTEDYDFPQRIRRAYGNKSTGRIREYIYHDEGKLSLISLSKKKFYYAKSIRVYKELNPEEYYQQVNILKRFMLFFSKPRKLFSNPIVGLGMLFMKSVEYGAGGLGYLYGNK